MFSAIAGIISSGAIGTILGPITGLLGNWMKGKQQLKEKETDNAHEEKMIGLKTTYMLQEVDANIKRDQIQSELKMGEKELEMLGQVVKEADKRIFKDAYVKDLMGLPPLWGTKSYLGPFLAAMVITAIAIVDLWRQSMRPGLTTYLIIVDTWITYISWDILKMVNGTGIDPHLAQEIFVLNCNTLCYLATASVTFWFCDRAKGLKDKIVGSFNKK